MAGPSNRQKLGIPKEFAKQIENSLEEVGTEIFPLDQLPEIPAEIVLGKLNFPEIEEAIYKYPKIELTAERLKQTRLRQLQPFLENITLWNRGIWPNNAFSFLSSRHEILFRLICKPLCWTPSYAKIINEFIIPTGIPIEEFSKLPVHEKDQLARTHSVSIDSCEITGSTAIVFNRAISPNFPYCYEGLALLIGEANGPAEERDFFLNKFRDELQLYWERLSEKQQNRRIERARKYERSGWDAGFEWVDICCQELDVDDSSDEDIPKTSSSKPRKPSRLVDYFPKY